MTKNLGALAYVDYLTTELFVALPQIAAVGSI